MDRRLLLDNCFRTNRVLDSKMNKHQENFRYIEPDIGLLLWYQKLIEECEAQEKKIEIIRSRFARMCEVGYSISAKC